MSESVKPVKCVCGGEAEIDGCGRFWVGCRPKRGPSCGRIGPIMHTADAAVVGWDKDMRALKHFDAMMEALHRIESHDEDGMIETRPGDKVGPSGLLSASKLAAQTLATVR